MHGKMIDVGFVLRPRNQNVDDAPNIAWDAARDAFNESCPGWTDESRDEFAEAVQCTVYKYMSRGAVQPTQGEVQVLVSCFRGIRCMEVYMTTLVWPDTDASVFAINRDDSVPVELTSTYSHAWR